MRSLELPPRGEALLHDVDVSEVAALQAQPAGYGWGPPLPVPALPRALRPAEPSGSAHAMLRVPCYRGVSDSLRAMKMLGKGLEHVSCGWSAHSATACLHGTAASMHHRQTLSERLHTTSPRAAGAGGRAQA